MEDAAALVSYSASLMCMQHRSETLCGLPEKLLRGTTLPQYLILKRDYHWMFEFFRTMLRKPNSLLVELPFGVQETAQNFMGKNAYGIN